jgi:hypothetical protein
MLLPCDGISTLQTLSWWIETESSAGFVAVLKMPLNSSIKGSIKVSLSNDKLMNNQ